VSTRKVDRLVEQMGLHHMRQALAARDMGAVITIFRRWTGASQTEVGVLLGMSQPHVSDFERGIRHATSLAMFERSPMV
jgi:predicted transcriptional regulator